MTTFKCSSFLFHKLIRQFIVEFTIILSDEARLPKSLRQQIIGLVSVCFMFHDRLEKMVKFPVFHVFGAKIKIFNWLGGGTFLRFQISNVHVYFRNMH